MSAALRHQPALPDFEMPEELHARGKPSKMKSKVSGAGNRITRPHQSGDRVIALVELKVGGVGFELVDDGEIYVETLKVVDFFELANPYGVQLLTQVRSLYRTGADAAAGLAQVPGLGDVGYTDESGVVLTPAEVAERRGLGKPVVALEGVVVIYDNGDKDLWPDDFDEGVGRPLIGAPNGRGGLVVELLNHRTGEPVARSFAGDGGEGAKLADGVPAFDDFEAPDGALSGELPTTADFGFVNVTIKLLTEQLQAVDSVPRLRRLLKAEQQGRGVGGTPRAGAVAAIEARIGAVESLAAAGAVSGGDEW